MAGYLVSINSWEMAKGIFGATFQIFWFFMKDFWWVFLILILGAFLKNFSDRKNPYSSKKTYVDENGYRRFLNSNMLVHRWVAEKKLGRKLNEEEVVHHGNGNKLDNRPNNLEVFANQEEHDKEHGYDN